MFITEDLTLFSGTTPQAKNDQYIEKITIEQYSLPLGCPICLGTGRIEQHFCSCGFGDRLRTIRDAATISDGTLGTLTGVTKYDELDVIRESWLYWLEDNQTVFTYWQTAWEAYQDSLKQRSDVCNTSDHANQSQTKGGKNRRQK
jgi:hypothetical protein